MVKMVEKTEIFEEGFDANIVKMGEKYIINVPIKKIRNKLIDPETTYRVKLIPIKKEEPEE
jgi:hypothetical protein